MAWLDARPGATVFLRTGARPSVLGLLLAGLLLAAACGHKTSAAQTLRTCVDRWNRGNMLGWGPTLASVGVALRRVKAGEQSRCVVALAVSYKRQTGSRCYDHPVPGHSDYCFRRSQTYVCVMEHFGAYVCPTNAEGSPPLRNENATVDRRGALTLQVSLEAIVGGSGVER